jgi:hypothetical protein
MSFTFKPARRAALIGGVAATIFTLAPQVAQASVVQWGPGTLMPGSEQCVSAGAASDAAVVGSADSPGVVYKVYRGSELVFDSASRRTVPLNKYFGSPGFYRFCAKNAVGLNQPVNNVSIKVLTDADA